jgi:hypothetical protein
MNEPARPTPRPGRRGAFDPEPNKPKPKPRQLPQAPEEDHAPMSLGQIIGGGLLILCGFALVAVFALGLPLEMIGGNAVLAVPLLALLFLMRGRRGRR